LLWFEGIELIFDIREAEFFTNLKNCFGIGTSFGSEREDAGFPGRFSVFQSALFRSLRQAILLGGRPRCPHGLNRHRPDAMLASNVF
jgi:hypothetical protein